MKELAVKVEKNEKIAEGIFRLVLRLPEVVPVRCGQFLNLSVGDGAHLLRRPFAVCRSEGEEVSVCYQLKGEGTHILSRAKAGDALSCVFPLGNGFTVGEEQKRVALVGGGVGVFPMLSVLYEYAGKGKQLFSFIGFRNRGAVCCERNSALFPTGVCSLRMTAVSAKREMQYPPFLKSMRRYSLTSFWRAGRRLCSVP